MDPRLARYPFLPATAEWMAREGPALEEVLTDPVWAAARARGQRRLLLALEDAAIPAPALTDASSPRELLEETLSYVYARILVSALDDAWVVRRHALAEAVRVKAHLEREDDPEVARECALAVGLAFEPEGRTFRTHFTEYLKQAVHLKDLEWKLVRQPLKGGIVQMDLATTARLTQEALRRRIETELPKELAPEVAKAVEGDLTELRAIAAARKERYSAEGVFGKVDLTLLPPCMQHILGQLQRGENAAHNARFAIVTFLHKIGMTSEDIMRLFAQAPDFKEEMTRYQVEHITGKSSGTTYSVPGCDNLQTFNLCFADDVCRSKTRDGMSRVRYPGDYYRYMQEAKPIVDAVAARVPLAEPVALSRALAESYGLLKAYERAVAAPWIERVTPEDALLVIAERKLPMEVKDGKVALGEDKRAVLMLLESQWLREAVLRRASAATAP